MYILHVSSRYILASGLVYFINGRQESFKTQPTNLTSPGVNDFHELTLSKPNSNSIKDEMLPLKIDKFVTWPRVLLANRIAKAFNQRR